MEKKPILRRATDAFVGWCAEDTASARFERTVAQGVVAAVVAGVTTGSWGAGFATALIMAILSPIQAMLGSADEEDAEDEEEVE